MDTVQAIVQVIYYGFLGFVVGWIIGELLDR